MAIRQLNGPGIILLNNFERLNTAAKLRNRYWNTVILFSNALGFCANTQPFSMNLLRYLLSVKNKEVHFHGVPFYFYPNNKCFYFFPSIISCATLLGTS